MKNETLTDNIKKTNYTKSFIKLKSENKKTSKIYSDKGKIRIIQTLSLSPLALSFGPDEKNKKNELYKTDKNSPINNILKNKFITKNKLLEKGKLKLIKNKFSLSKIFVNNTFESNKENKFINILNCINQNQNQNNLFIEHKKIDFSNVINFPYNKKKKVKNKSYIHSDNSTKYKTIFTKYNNTNINNISPEEQSCYFEVFSSKYKNKKEEENKNISNNKNKLFKNEEISKIELHRFVPHSTKKNKKYFQTETTSNLNSIFSENKNGQFFNKTENSKNYNNSFKPIFNSKNKKRKINLKLMIQKLKNKLLSDVAKNKNSYYKNGNRVKYSPIDLNLLAKIPNRIIPIDNHGNEIKEFKININSTLANKNKFNSLKQNFGDIKHLRQFLNHYHSNNISRNNSKKILNFDNRIIQNNNFKTFYKNNDNHLNDIGSSNIKINNDYIKNKKIHFLSGKINRTKRVLEFKKIQINVISV